MQARLFCNMQIPEGAPGPKVRHSPAPNERSEKSRGSAARSTTAQQRAEHNGAARRRRLPRHRSAQRPVPAHSTRSGAAAAHGAPGQSRAQSERRAQPAAAARPSRRAGAAQCRAPGPPLPQRPIEHTRLFILPIPSAAGGFCAFHFNCLIQIKLCFP